MGCVFLGQAVFRGPNAKEVQQQTTTTTSSPSPSHSVLFSCSFFTQFLYFTLFFSINMQNVPLLIRFPPEIRTRIYSYLGLIRGEYIHLHASPTNNTAVGEWSSARQEIKLIDTQQIAEIIPDWTPDFCAECFRCRPMATQLFYISRAVSDDVRSTLYSQNLFMVCNRTHVGLSSLLDLTPVATRSLCRLAVRLDQSVLDSFDDLDPVDDDILSILPLWRQFCDRLAAHLKPDQLELVVVCHVKKALVAEALLAPLLQSQLPRLKSCSIRLGPYRDDRLQNKIKQTVENVTGKRVNKYQFSRFFDLPVEVQQHVLSYTELLAPSPVLWDSKKQMFIPQSCISSPDIARDCGAEWFAGSSYCPSIYLSYSSLYTPHGLLSVYFQVCKRLKAQAEYVFYARNRFIIDIQGPDFYLPSFSPSEWRLENSQFLHPFPPEHLHLLRYIRWEFPDMDNSTDFLLEQPMTVDFTKSIDFIARHIPTSNLTLIIDLSYDELNRYAVETRLEDFDSTAEMKWALYQRIIQLVVPRLKELGLKDFFVHISWPIKGWNDHLRDQREQILERMVQGVGYDSFQRGKERTRYNGIPGY